MTYKQWNMAANYSKSQEWVQTNEKSGFFVDLINYFQQISIKLFFIIKSKLMKTLCYWKINDLIFITFNFVSILFGSFQETPFPVQSPFSIWLTAQKKKLEPFLLSSDHICISKDSWVAATEIKVLLTFIQKKLFQTNFVIMKIKLYNNAMVQKNYKHFQSKYCPIQNFLSNFESSTT